MLNLILEGGKKRKPQCSGKASFQPAEVQCLTLKSPGPESMKSFTALTSSGGSVQTPNIPARDFLFAIVLFNATA